MNRRWIYLFPPGWRRDYGPDLAETLSSLPLSANNVVDLVDGAGDAWISASFGRVFHRRDTEGRVGADGDPEGPNGSPLTLPAPAARHRGPVWALAAAGWSLILLFYATVLAYATSSSGGPHEATRTASYSLAAVKGPLFLVMVVLFPLLLSIACLVASQFALNRELRWASVTAWGCVALSWVLSLGAIPSFGIFLLPVAVLLTVGTAGTSVWRATGRLFGRLAWPAAAVAWSAMVLVGACASPYRDTVERWVIRNRRGIMTSEGTRTVSHTLVATKGIDVLLFPLGIPLLLSIACFAALWLGIRHGLRWAHIAAWVCVGLVWVDCAVAVPTVGWVLFPVPVLLTLGAATWVAWPTFATRSGGPGWALLAVAWASLLVIGAAIIPFNQILSTSVSAGGLYVTKTSMATFFATEGFLALILFGLPVLLSGVCFVSLWFARGHYVRWIFVAIWVCVGLVWLECLFGLASISLYLIPVAVLLTISASRAPQASTV